jgi:hypothetical protein
MKSHIDKNHILWLLMIIAALVALAIYRIGFFSSVPGFDEEKLKSIQNNDSQQEKTAPSGSSQESEFQTSPTDDLKKQQPKQSANSLRNPKYFRVVFGKEGKNSMLGVIKESEGTHDGYNVAYIDENMNGDLTDEVEKRFSRYRYGSRAGLLEPKFEFQGPFKEDKKAIYTLYLYSLIYKLRARTLESSYGFHWAMNAEYWYYFFINGRMEFYSSADAAQNGKPIHLISKCQWDISTRTQRGDAVISAGLKDKNGCTLRVVRNSGQTISPKLTLTKEDKIVMEEEMKFG